VTLRVEGLEVRYGSAVALRGIDLEIPTGEVVAVLGPSGSGKSTLLRAVAGLEPPAAGRVTWDGTDLAGLPPHRRGFGLMFQEHLLFPHADVAGNVAFGLRMHGWPHPEVTGRVRELLELVGLPGYWHRSVASLSGGEAQRVALARALAPRPRLLMLDEPLGSLDRPQRTRLVGELGVLLRAEAATSIVVTHDQDEAFALADRVVVLVAGRVVEDGPSARVWARPASVEAARFLGFVNETTGDHDGRLVRCPWGTFPAPCAPRGRVRLLARPDALHLRPGATVAHGPDAPSFSARVRGRTFRADRFLVELNGTHGPLLAVCDPDRIPPPGAPVTVAVEVSRLVTLPDPGSQAAGAAGEEVAR
jgi:thiamine transport system ATP-binding protein